MAEAWPTSHSYSDVQNVVVAWGLEFERLALHDRTNDRYDPVRRRWPRQQE